MIRAQLIGVSSVSGIQAETSDVNVKTPSWSAVVDNNRPLLTTVESINHCVVE